MFLGDRNRLEPYLMILLPEMVVAQFLFSFNASPWGTLEVGSYFKFFTFKRADSCLIVFMLHICWAKFSLKSCLEFKLDTLEI